MQNKVKAVESPTLSKPYDKRFVIIDENTGEILDDAQGYGYRTAQKAHLAYAYKHRDTSKDKEKEQKYKDIRMWMKKHKGFMRNLDAIAFDIAVGKWGPDAKVDAKLVRELLKEANLEVDFKVRDFLTVWGRGYE